MRLPISLANTEFEGSQVPLLRRIKSQAVAPRRRPEHPDLDLVAEIGAQCERAVIVQPLVACPSHGVAHSLYFNLS
jgi:hypothetical protein